MNRLAFLRRTLYSLKRAYGNPIGLYKLTPGDTDPRTGVKSVERTKYKIRKAIILPAKFQTVMMYGSAYLKNAREFAMGAYSTQDMKQILIDGRDLPKNLSIDPDMYIMYQHKKYEIKFLEELDEKSGYALVCVGVTGTEVDEQYDRVKYQSIRILQTVSYIHVHTKSITQTLNMNQGVLTS